MNKELQEFTNSWIGREGIIAIAEGKYHGERCIVVYLTDQNLVARYGIPEVYKGIVVLIRVSPPIDNQAG